MPWRNPPNRSNEYRKRAEETRTKAELTTEEGERKTLLQMAETWERMAAYEEVHNPPRRSPGLP